MPVYPTRSLSLLSTQTSLTTWASDLNSFFGNMAPESALAKSDRYSQNWPSSVYHDVDVEKGERNFIKRDDLTLQSRSRNGKSPLIHNHHEVEGDCGKTSGLNGSSCTGSISTLPEESKEGDNEERSPTTNVCAASEAPAPKYSRAWMNILRWEWLSVYRRLNICVVSINILIVIVFAAQGKLLKMGSTDMATALTANIMTAVLIRQEYVVNLLFVVFGCCPQTLPLWFRRLATKIYHFGGVHSGAGMASTIWLVFYNIALVMEYCRGPRSGKDDAVLAITGLLDSLLVSVLVTSYPKFRTTYHDIWEQVHRFAGWTSIVLLWSNFGLLTDINRQQNESAESIFKMLVTSPVFWMLFIISICLILPWLRLRRVSVRAECQSEYAIRLHFTHDNLPLCAAPRISRSPLFEWHSFAGIPEENGEGFSLLVSRAGDWTKAIIANPPTHLWVRGLPVRGVLHLAPIFRRIVLVATGSGIGPVLSLLVARSVDCRILWSTRNPAECYKPDIVEKVLLADPKAVIMNRPKNEQTALGQMAYDLLKECDAEAVFIIANPTACYNGRIWLESRGVPVFTPIFDS